MIVKADQAAIFEAAQIIRAGGIVAFPTETVYGLGADATQGEAVARIFEAKGRPRFNPLIVHVADLEAAIGLAAFNDKALALARHFWPGPLSLVLPLSKTLSTASANLSPRASIRSRYAFPPTPLRAPF